MALRSTRVPSADPNADALLTCDEERETAPATKNLRQTPPDSPMAYQSAPCEIGSPHLLCLNAFSHEAMHSPPREALRS
jgi:hypothetical protein